MRHSRSSIIPSSPVSWASLAIALLAATPAVPAQEPARPATTQAAAKKADSLVDQLVEGHNKERAAAGLPQLRLEARLTEAARIHALDMAATEKMAHEGSDGSTPQQRITGAGYHGQRTGENVAVGYEGVTGVMQGWMDSPPHKKNILGDFAEIGVAMAIGKDGKPYWSAEFGTPWPSFDPATASADLLKRINAERVTAKLPSLSVDTRLAKAAQGQASNLAKDNAKEGPSASFDGVDQKAYQDLALSTASGNPDAESLVAAILANPGLKTQVLGKFTRIGVGYATADDGKPFWCLILANPARK